jgi:hypothetical protein
LVSSDLTFPAASGSSETSDRIIGTNAKSVDSGQTLSGSSGVFLSYAEFQFAGQAIDSAAFGRGGSQA